MKLYPTELNEKYCQWTFLPPPQHPVLVKLIDEIPRNILKKFSDDPMLDFPKRTGPHLFTRVLKDYLKGGGTVTVMPSSYFGCCEGSSALRFSISFLFPELFRKVYIRHHFAGTWISKELKREVFLRNVFFIDTSKRKRPN